MTTSRSGFHEDPEVLSTEARDRHRAIVTIIEELEAIDWYDQRAEACSDPELRKILIHHRNEEIEHALMALEWIRRRSPEFDEYAKTYLFTAGPLSHLEEISRGAGGPGEAGSSENREGCAGASLGIGNLKRS